ncbi:hypothetical protein [Bacillus cereus]|uniref:hypothetical protein n=1 Tax=Bacillus cereus TaxID=1396 RepID=UPI000BFAE7E6|nr:hypothetical protein [Bacillus cereus]PFD41435.1 hypothetical protein CN281_27015 [Bacillus cereus]
MKINCKVYPSRDNLETNDGNILSEKAIDLSINENGVQSTMSLDYKGMKKLRKHLKKQMRVLENFFGDDYDELN